MELLAEEEKSVWPFGVVYSDCDPSYFYFVLCKLFEAALSSSCVLEYFLCYVLVLFVTFELFNVDSW